MGNNIFDPFQQRKARDIRNTLSSVFSYCMKIEDISPMENIAEKLLRDESSTLYKLYIKDRLNRYQKCLSIIEGDQIENPLEQAFILWDEELFFEVHEILEEIWMSASGDKKAALQGLIRAAGVYVLLKNNRIQGAAKMAAKAVTALEKYHKALNFFPNRDLLLKKLRDLDPTPPKLHRKAT